MREHTVSVAMATYNGERFLQEQLDSLARQTLLPFELVACDDGSTDGTLDILHHFAAKAPFPVRIYRNESRLGWGPNALRAASLCSGGLVAFCDQDDVWLERKLQRCADALSSTGSVLLIHSALVVAENLAPSAERTPSARRLTRLDAGGGMSWHPVLTHRLPLIPGFTCVFRAEMLRQIPPVPPLAGPGVPHERWLVFASEAAGCVTLLPDALALYRQHGRNAIGFLAHVPNKRGATVVFRVGQTEYARQSETARIHAQLLADAARRCPEARSRLTRAQRWYEARANSLARRASLYGEASSAAATARRLLSMAVSGNYKPISQGGLGLKGLAKDLFMPLLGANLSGARHGSISNS